MSRRGSWSGLTIIAITTFFLGSFLLLVLFGTNSYRHIAESQAENNHKRALLSYLLTAGKMSESDIYAGVTDTQEDMLVIADGDTGYGSRIYMYDGYLVEDYGRIGGQLMPSSAIRIAETDHFTIEETDAECLKIDTGEGTVYLHTGKGDR